MELCQQLQPLFEQRSWEALLQWLDSEEDSQILKIKTNTFLSVDEAALTAAGAREALKLIGRLRSLQGVVSKILTKDSALQRQ